MKIARTNQNGIILQIRDVIKNHLKTLTLCAGIFAVAMPSYATITMSSAAVGSSTDFPTLSISAANGNRSFSSVGTASGATIATGGVETRWTTNGVAWGEVFKWSGTNGAVLSAYSMIVNSITSGSYRPFLFDLGAVTFNTTSSTFNPSSFANRLSNVTLTPAAISAKTFLEFDLSGSDAVTLTNGHSYAFGLLNTSTGNINIERSSGVTSDPNGAPFQITSGGLSGTSATVPPYGSGVRNHFIGVYTKSGSTNAPPAAPTGLSATTGNGQVALSWTASSGATSYNVKRSTTSGGPYTTVASPTTTSYVNTGLANGTTYYYVVSAVNTSGESPNSSQVSATPTGSTSIPYVYSSENTGTGCAAPPMPAPSSLPSVQPLPDPFMWVSSYMNKTYNSRSTAFSDWECHRNETAAMIQNYEIGTKPTVNSSQVTASYSGSTSPGGSGTLTVKVTVNGVTVTLTSAVTIPSGATAPYPICIGMDSPYGSLNSSDFTSRGIVGVTFSESQVSTYGSPSSSDPFFKAYPSQNPSNTGQYAAWSWGISRIIDGLKAQSTLPVDMNHICVTGCSYAGKMALFGGAFDERVALTIAQESGGGGDTSWRYSHTEPSGTVECVDNTDYNWFMDAMKSNFSGNNVSLMPEDHHMLMAMCAPRALYCTANTDYTWLSNPSAYVCGQACANVYSTLGIADRFGFNVDGGHSHCTFPSDQESDVQYFLNKFIKGQTSLSQTIRTSPSSYSSIDYSKWTTWWGTTNPVFGP
jgi:hypothetical protein